MRTHLLGIRRALVAGAVLASPQLAVAQSTAFDGKWNVALTCPPANDSSDGAKGYSHRFSAEVKDGQLLGLYGKEGDPGSQRLSGRIAEDGSADLRLDGVVGDPDFAIGRSPAGKAFTYRVRAKFDASSGTGQRTGGRVCEFRFTR